MEKCDSLCHNLSVEFNHSGSPRADQPVQFFCIVGHFSLLDTITFIMIQSSSRGSGAAETKVACSDDSVAFSHFTGSITDGGGMEYDEMETNDYIGDITIEDDPEEAGSESSDCLTSPLKHFLSAQENELSKMVTSINKMSSTPARIARDCNNAISSEGDDDLGLVEVADIRPYSTRQSLVGVLGKTLYPVQH